MIKFTAIFFVASLAYVQSTWACQFDTDCQPGSTCIKSGYQLYGACVGGISPGNSNDRQPVYNTFDLNKNTWDTKKDNDNGTYGDTCSFDLDCGIGGRCAKSSGSIRGTCM